MPIMSITEKGQVVIPKELREKHGIEVNGEVIVTEVSGHIAVLPAPKDPIEALKGSLKLRQPVADIIQEFRRAETKRDQKLLKRFVRENEDRRKKSKRK